MPLPVKTRYDVTVRGRPLPKYFLIDEVHAILAHTNNDRDHLIINMLWQTGARVSELLLIKVNDIDPHMRIIRIVTLKQGIKGNQYLQRVVPIEKNLEYPEGDLILEIERYIEKHNLKPDDLLFNLCRYRINQIIQEVCKRVGLDRKRAHPHTFRHSYGVHLVLNKVHPFVIQELMGHADSNSTKVYTRVLAADARPFLEGIKW